MKKVKSIISTVPCEHKDPEAKTSCKLSAEYKSAHEIAPAEFTALVIFSYDCDLWYRCSDGHITTKSARLDREKLFGSMPDGKDDSPKRFRRKGFTGHAVNPAGSKRLRRQRRLLRRARI